MAEGSSECPVCGWDTPHSHDANYDDSANRPAIDGARIAFEREMRATLELRAKEPPRSRAICWDWEGRRARHIQSNFGHGWSARGSYQGNYLDPMVQQSWCDWRASWLMARALTNESNPHG